jgi:hypothetical protein
MTDWVRVRNKVNPTSEYTRAVADPKRHDVLDKPAVDSHGDPLPAKPINNPKSPAKSDTPPDANKATPAETKEKS